MGEIGAIAGLNRAGGQGKVRTVAGKAPASEGSALPVTGITDFVSVLPDFALVQAGSAGNA
jgi:hypothetical protein